MWFLMLGAAVGCASKGDSLGGTGSGGTSQSGGGPGTGGLSQSGGAPGTGGSVVDAGNVPPELAAAEATWAASKPSCSAYSYQVQSSNDNACQTTTVYIQNDQPIERSYTLVRGGCDSAADASVSSQWDEIGADQIGTNAGLAPWTVEQMFSECQTVLTTNQFGVSFVVNSDGVPMTCTETENSCVSDCNSTGGPGNTTDCNAQCTSGRRLSWFVCQPAPG
jgi:hypothetical protein